MNRRKLAFSSIGPRCRAAASSRRADDFRSLASSANSSLESSRSLARESTSRFSPLWSCVRTIIFWAFWEGQAHTKRPSLPEVPPAPIADPVDIESSKEDLAQGSADRETANRSVSKSKKKRSAPSSSTSIEAHTEPPKKKKKKKKEKRKKKPVEERSEPSQGVDGRELVVHGDSSRKAAAQIGVELDDSPTVPLGDYTNERSNEPTGRDLGELSVRERGDVSGVERTEDGFEPTNATTVPNPAPAVVNLAVGEEAPTPTLGASNEDPTLPRGEGRTGSDSDDLFKLSDSSAEEGGGDKSNEQVPESNLLGTEEDLGESSAKEQGNIDGVENPSDSTTDRTEDVSPLGAQVVGEGLDHVKD
ncbi:hypothetical protein F2Q69_00021420 [Brassica cretica]|uniref:Uncharacterized protein n=1 Tax=Brassica cretica TaxID=69181 RepID=A0A8S9QH45_BRACR|nr:hypothetical protein F2Q69_00021420 [Brassica cretica]